MLGVLILLRIMALFARNVVASDLFSCASSSDQISKECLPIVYRGCFDWSTLMPLTCSVLVLGLHVQ